MSMRQDRSLADEFQGVHDAVVVGVRLSRHRAATAEQRPLVLECAKDYPPYEEFCIAFHGPAFFRGRGLDLLNIIYDVSVRPLDSVSDAELAEACGMTVEEAAKRPTWAETRAYYRAGNLQLAWIDSSIGLSGPVICKDVTVESADWAGP